MIGSAGEIKGPEDPRIQGFLGAYPKPVAEVVLREIREQQTRQEER